MSDVPAPTRRRAPEPLEGQRESERLSPGSFFAEQKALVDHKRDHLARLGMDERHVAALRMPERHEPVTEPVAKPNVALGAQVPADAPKRAPRGEFVRGDHEE
jgi:hypothetical protein